MVWNRGRSGLWRRASWAVAAIMLLTAQVAWARPPQMHIIEGFLPAQWAAFWYAATVPFWVLGFRRISRLVRTHPEARLGLGLAAAFTLVLSALKLPSVTGSSSHPTGTGLGAILFGPSIMSVLGSIALLFQALLLAHGGITTLGANVFSMAVVGPAAGWWVYRLLKWAGPSWVSVFLAGFVADLATYIVTSLELALAYPDPVGGIAASLLKFGAIFAITQVPLAIGDGIVTVLAVNALRATEVGGSALVGTQEG